MKTTELLDAAKEAQGIPSDYAMAKRLAVSRSRMSEWRNGREFLSDEMAVTVAAMAGIDPAKALAWVHVERARTPETRAAWQRAAEQLTAVAGWLFATLILLGALSAPLDAHASENAKRPNVGRSLFVMSTRRLRALFTAARAPFGGMAFCHPSADR